MNSDYIYICNYPGAYKISYATYEKKSVPVLPGFWLLWFVLAVLRASVQKTVTYFNNLPDSARIQLANLTPQQQYIQVNDVLDIRVGGENEKTVQYLSQYANNNSSIYTVDLDGNIELPKVGRLR